MFNSSDKEYFYELVDDYMDAMEIKENLLLDTPWGDIKFMFTDEDTLRMFFEDEQDASDCANTINSAAGDIYQCTNMIDETEAGWVTDIRLINDNY